MFCSQIYEPSGALKPQNHGSVAAGTPKNKDTKTLRDEEELLVTSHPVSL